MIVAGIIGNQGKVQTANIINSILSSMGYKVSVIDSKSLMEIEVNIVKSYLLELDKNNVDILVLKINSADVGKKAMKGLHFDIIIYTDKADDLKEEQDADVKEVMRWIFSMMDEKGVVIINFDDGNIVKSLNGVKNSVVTYGFNSKADITTSSIGDTAFEDSFICCLQETIPAKNGQIVEPQEYRINIESREFDRHNVLAAAAFAIINGIDLNSIRRTGDKI